MKRHIPFAFLFATALAACSGDKSVVGGQIDAGAEVTAKDVPASDQQTFDTPDTAADVVMDTPKDNASDVSPDVSLDVSLDASDGATSCRSNNDCMAAGLGACDTTTGRCVECVASADTCPAARHCDAATNRCVDGCRADDGCTGDTARCDVTTHTCVRCVTDEHCPAGNLCRDRACVPGCTEARGCPDPQRCCAGACVDTSASTSNCGACGMACTVANATAACVMSRCAVGRCEGTFGDCDMNATNGCETDTSASTANCGACGMACDLPNATAACTAGRCAIARCDAGFADCDMNPANGCEVTLGTGANCARCGDACGAGTACSMGACASVCAAGQTFCATSSMCATLATSVSNCGACGNVCPARANASQTCAGGTCGFTCDTGFGDCDMNASNGCETATATSREHCGRCGGACPGATNAVGICTGGACLGFTCNAGFGNCDMNASNGCETNTSSNVTHCGGCGVVCAAGANATATCTGGRCGLTCAPGFADCDGVATNGCESRTAFDSANCGACGTRCGSSQRCFSGRCAEVTTTGIAVPGLAWGGHPGPEVITRDGRVASWSGSAWVVQPGITNAIEISCGYGRCVALTRANEVWAYGEFGCNGDYRVPERVGTNVAHVTAGVHIEYGVTLDGRVFRTPDRCYGTSALAAPTGLVRDVAVSIANEYCLLFEDGALRCYSGSGMVSVPTGLPNDFVRIVATWGGTFLATTFYCGQRVSGAVVCWAPGGSALQLVAGMSDGSVLGNQSATYAAAMTGINPTRQARVWHTATETPQALFSTTPDVAQISGERYGESCVLRATGAVRCTSYMGGTVDMPVLP